jgi:hypothetical protein
MSLATVLLVVLAPLGGVTAADSADEAAALVVSTSGRPAFGSASGADARPLHAFDWLAAGALIVSDRESSAVVALANGRRFEIGPDTRVRVGRESLEVLKGRVLEQARVAPLPRLAALSPEVRPGSRAGALRIRGRRIHDLYPAGDATVRRDGALLGFSTLPGIARYEVEVEDEEGEVVFRAETPGPTVAVSPEALRPGARYRWQVKGASALGPARAEAEFSTLDEEEAAARQRLRASLEGTADAESLALLAEVDRGLGLLREARETFARALESSPGNESLRAAIERVDTQLRDPQLPE